MSELSTSISLCVNGAKLVELACYEFTNEMASTLAENENIVLPLEELSDFLIDLEE